MYSFLKTLVPEWGFGPSRILCCIFFHFLVYIHIIWYAINYIQGIQYMPSISNPPSALQATLAAKDHLIEQLRGKASIESVHFIPAQWISILFHQTSRFQYYRVWFCDVWNYLRFFLHLILFIFRLKVFSTWMPPAVSRPVTWKQRHWKREVHSLHSPSRLQHVSSRAIQTFQKFQTPVFACLQILQIAWFAWFALCFVSCFILLSFLHLP